MAILITGVPGVGKTTVLERLAGSLGDRASGFITAEVREAGQRTGFDIESFERIALPALVFSPNKILIIDEIGKMELYSPVFREMLILALDSGMPVVAAIMRKSHPFADMIKSRPDCRLIEITRSNRDGLPGRLKELCGA